MAVIKCKMCGGDLKLTEESSVVECEYCGSRQTVPNQDNEKKLTLFGRANRLRLSCEFDKAAGVYESIVAEFPEEAEAYWGLVLCRYGIEYVDDPRTGKKIPTCHRSSFDSVLEDADFEQACENADVVARKVYREEAKAIEELRRGILEVSGKEAPYDIFICYKETDDAGDRTIDSVIAQEVYEALTEKGYRVFFSRISLEDKLGQEYEPYIFAALNSAKVMLVFGTDYEYFNAVWVKNEWSRYLALIASGQKKTLIPCYKNIDAYDMPKEFARLQAQDMGKVGATQDLLRGIEKILSPKVDKPAEATVPASASVSGGGPTVASLLKRGNIFLSDKEWAKATEYFDKVLDIDPENGDAYVGKLCAEMEYRSLADMAEAPILWEIPGEAAPAELPEAELNRYRPRQSAQTNLDKALRYGGPDLTVQLKEAAAAGWKSILKEEKARRERNKKLAATRKLLSCGDEVIVGLRSDGTVVATGDNSEGQCNVSGWKNIVAVAADEGHTVGLRSDGTVVATGNNSYGKCNTRSWRNIVAVAVGVFHTVGLRSDGTVTAIGNSLYDQCNVSGWTSIIAVAAGCTHTVGLRSDGTVVVTGDNQDFQRNTGTWRNIVAVAAGTFHAVGLRSDGTVVATGGNQDGQCDTGSWTDIMAVAAGEHHTVGLRSDGTVVAVGDNSCGQCDTASWTDIVGVAAGGSWTVGLRSDGTVVTVGGKKNIGLDVTGWKLFDSVEQLDHDMAERINQGAELRRQRAAQERAELEAQRAALQAEAAGLKGLLADMRRRKLEEQIAALTARIDQLAEGK